MAYCVPSAFVAPSGGAYIVPSANPFTSSEFVTPSPLIPPVGPITGITITNLTPYSFTATLNPVDYATNYHFQWGTFGSNNTLPTINFSILPPATSNDLLITAYNEDGSVFSSPTPVTTGIPAPAKPTGLVASSITGTSFDVSWNPAQYADSYIAAWGIIAPTDLSGTRASFTNLPFGTTSNVIIYSSNVYGPIPSDPLPVSTLYPAPGQPTGLTAYNIQDIAFDCSWAAASLATSYGAMWGGYTGIVNGTTATFRGLTANSTSNLVVTAYNPGGSNVSAPLSVTTFGPPAPATGLTAYSITNTSFDCSWSPVANAQSYSANWGSFVGDISGTTARFTGLPGDTTNNVIVATSNSFGTSTSLPLSVSTTGVAPPAAPTGLTVTKRGVDYFQASWSNVSGVTYDATVNGSISNVIVISNTMSVTGLVYNSDSNSLIVTASNAGGVTPSSPLYVDLLEAQLVSFTGGLSSPPFPVGTSTGTITTFTIPSDFDVTRNVTTDPEFISVVGSKVYYDTTVPDGTAFSYYMLSPPATATNSYTFLTDSNVGADVCPAWNTSVAWSLYPGQPWEFQYLVTAPNEFQLGTDIMYQFTYNPFSNA